jgi:hypothetical protein
MSQKPWHQQDWLKSAFNAWFEGKELVVTRVVREQVHHGHVMAVVWDDSLKKFQDKLPANFKFKVVTNGDDITSIEYLKD